MTCKDCISEKVCKYKNQPIPLCDCTYEESNNVEKIGCPFKSKTTYAEVKWVSVEDRLPEENKRVLVAIEQTVQNDYTEIDTDRIKYGVWVRWGRKVTHWMPLPELPKGE